MTPCVSDGDENVADYLSWRALRGRWYMPVPVSPWEKLTWVRPEDDACRHLAGGEHVREICC
jgi:hypothetical protein